LLYNIIKFLSDIGSAVGEIITSLGIIIYLINQHKNNPHINTLAGSIIASGLLLIIISTFVHFGAIYA
jgi:xanthine/uracil permease